MENKITDINDLVACLTAAAMKPLLNDNVWQCYGYNKRPIKGNIWNKLFPKKFELDNFITREILTMGLIDILNGIKKSNQTFDTKLLISIGLIDQYLSTTKHLFSEDLFMENLFSSYYAFKICDKSKLHEPFILKAKDVLNKKNFAKFMVGTIRLLAIEHAADYLLNSNNIKDFVDNSLVENILKISMPEEKWREYGKLISEKILKV
ncbi:MAG: hypothetical protein HYW86_03875 [Candidatus Roizmanbacteria bacterium]|nr:MAG: hypothetical protein HYW86_03875 [Candidatus Roizmanbacteria bacterium]